MPSEAKKFGIDLEYAWGRKANPNAGREFVVTSPWIARGKVENLHIWRKFNLGNHVRQVANAVRFAEIHNIRNVYLPEGSVFGEGDLGAVQLRPHDSGGDSGRTLHGDFFYYEKLGISDDDLDRARILRQLRPMVGWEVRPSLPSTLTIHLRAGDSFGSSPHPLYAPPPLAFFLGAIEKSFAKQILVIAQSVSHHYVEAIRAYCRDTGKEFFIESGTLEEDFGLLMGARNLCLSQGTLALAAAWLSPHCETVYGFDRDSNEIMTTSHLNIETRSVTLKSGHEPWRNEPEQLQRLLNTRPDELAWS
jgi:hypothetical protein